jgi:hypothetical protein
MTPISMVFTVEETGLADITVAGAFFLTHIGSPSKNRTPVWSLQETRSTIELTGLGWYGRI